MPVSGPLFSAYTLRLTKPLSDCYVIQKTLSDGFTYFDIRFLPSSPHSQQAGDLVLPLSGGREGLYTKVGPGNNNLLTLQAKARPACFPPSRKILKLTQSRGWAQGIPSTNKKTKGISSSSSRSNSKLAFFYFILLFF